MVGFLPCKALDRGTVGVYAHHVGLHSLLDDMINLVIALVVALKDAILLPCAGDSMTVNCIYLNIRTAFFNRQDFTCEISEFLTPRFPGVVRPDLVGDNSVNIHPAFCHLIRIAVLIQFLCRIDAEAVPFLSFHPNFQYAGHVLSKVIDTPAICLMKILCLIGVNDLDGRLELLHQYPLRSFGFGENPCLIPLGVIEFRA